MNLVTIEAPAARVTSAREVLKFFNTPLGFVCPSLYWEGKAELRQARGLAWALAKDRTY